VVLFVFKAEWLLQKDVLTMWEKITSFFWGQGLEVKHDMVAWGNIYGQVVKGKGF